MRKNEFHLISGNEINKLNLLIVGFGVLAVCITGFCYTAHWKNRNNPIVKYVNRAEPYEEML